MHASLERKISIIVKMSSDEVARHSEIIRNKLDRMKGTLIALGLSGALTFGGMSMAVTSFAKEAITKSQEVERSQQRLKYTVESHKMSWEALNKTLNDYANTAERRVAVDNEEVLAGIKRFIDVGADAKDAMSAMNTTMDLAVGKEMDLGSAVELMTKAYLGRTEMLARYGVVIQTGLPAAQKFAAVQGSINKMFGGQATLQGAQGIKQLSLAWGELHESIGLFMNRGGAVSNVLKLSQNYIWGMVAGIDEFTQEAMGADKALSKRTLEEYFEAGKTMAKELAEKLRELYKWGAENLPKMWDMAKTAAMGAWLVIKPIVDWFVDNPKLALGGAMAIGLIKIIGLAKDLYLLLESMAGLAIIKTFAKLGTMPRVASMLGVGFAAAAPVAAEAGTGMAAGAAAGGLGAAGAGVGAISIGTILPVVLGVLGAAAVGYAIYRIWKSYAPSERPTPTAGQLAGQSEKVAELTTGSKGQEQRVLKDSLETYDRLSVKAHLGMIEQTALNMSIDKMIEIVPDAKGGVDQYGNAISVNTGKIRTAIDAFDAMARAQERQLDLMKSDALKQALKDVENLSILPSGYGENLQDQIGAINKQLDAIDINTLYEKKDAMEKLGIGIAEVTDAQGKTKRGARQWALDDYNNTIRQISGYEKLKQELENNSSYLDSYNAKIEEVTKILSNIYDTEDEKQYKALVRATNVAWADRVRLMQEAEKAKGKLDPGKPDKTLDADSQATITNFMKQAKATQIGLEGDLYNTSFALADEWYQKRIALETKYNEEVRKIKEDEEYIDLPEANKLALIKEIEKHKRTEIKLVGLQETTEKAKTLRDDLKAVRLEIDSLNRAKIVIQINNAQLETQIKALSNITVPGASKKITMSKPFFADNENTTLWLSEYAKGFKNAKTAQDLAQLSSIESQRKYEEERLQIAKDAQDEIDKINARLDLTPAGKKAEIQRVQDKADENTGISVGSRANDALKQLQDLQMQDKLASMTDTEQKIYDVNLQYSDMKAALLEDERVNHVNHADSLIALEEWKNKKLKEVDDIGSKARVKAWATGLDIMMKAGQLFAQGQIKIGNALKVASIQVVSEMVAGELEKKGKLWAAEALAAAASFNFASAAKFSAAAILAVSGASFIRAKAQSEIDKVMNEKDNSSEQLSNMADSGTTSTVNSAYSTRGFQNVYIQPSVTFSAETIIIGDTGLEQASQTIGDISVSAVQDALDTGEIKIPGVK